MNPAQPCTIPTLYTARLRMVAWEERHIDSFLRMHADPDTMRYIGEGKPMNQVEAWLHLATLIGHWQLRGYGVWALEQVATGTLVGRAGLFHPPGWPEPELNWMIDPAQRGKGFASEAAKAVLEYAFNEIGCDQIVSLVRPENLASAAVVRKLGGTLADTIDFMHAPMQVFRYTRPVSAVGADSAPGRP